MLNFYTTAFSSPNIGGISPVANKDTPKPVSNSGSENIYYNNFSKYVLISSETDQSQTKMELPFNYNDYIEKKLDIEKYKLPELKAVAKYYDLRISGNKPILRERILEYFKKTESATIIQRTFRGHIVRYAERLRGPALRDRNICVNETDFYTLEPLSEIPDMCFFSYKDEQHYVYGFHIRSIISLIAKTHKPTNPYNRIEFTYDTAVGLYRLYMIMRIICPSLLYPDFYEQNCTKTPVVLPTLPNIPNLVPRMPVSRMNQRTINANTNANTTHSDDSSPSTIDRQNPIPVSRESRQAELLIQLETIRAQPLEVRIRELFIEINLLGNYTESRWFTNLDVLRLARYYQAYYDWWFDHSRLDEEARHRVCVLDDPFADVGFIYFYPTTTIDEMREACVRLMENMVYGGIDLEHRKLGALHVLSILTIVSFPARGSMRWLYESLFTPS
jgi:hypothetical protein